MSLERWDEEMLQTAVASGKPLLVDLRADWCAQCGPQEGVLLRLAPDFAGRVAFASVDVEENTAVLDKYNISGLPALLLFRGGKLQETLRGFKRAPLVRMALHRLLQS